ncbi:hypothetical protein C8R43DRAFT_52342 [Mycena crocata]|nr:hypothetical protein C8R43DRAFT_52342 [Mycena crocata]
MSPSFATQNLPDLTGTFVDEGSLQLVQLLGCGSFAKVYKALDTTSSPDDPVFYAVKCMYNDFPGTQRKAAMRNEFSMHRAVSHQPGVVSFHYIFTLGDDAEFMFMLLDLGAGNMLDAVLQQQTYVDRPALVKEASLRSSMPSLSATSAACSTAI